MTAALYHKKLERALKQGGDLYSLSDILDAIAEGRMQSWVEGQSWVVTQIAIYPRRRVLEVVAAIGDLKDCRILHDKILWFAEEMGLGLVSAYGRLGWAREATRHGWTIQTRGALYHRKIP
jgi:hypothetical protein